VCIVRTFSLTRFDSPLSPCGLCTRRALLQRELQARDGRPGSSRPVLPPRATFIVSVSPALHTVCVRGVKALVIPFIILFHCAVASVFSVRIFAHRSSFYEIVTTQRNPSSRRYEEHCVFHITFNSMLLSRGGCSSIAVPVEILRQFTQLDRLSNVVAVWILQRETRSRGVIVKQFRKHPSVSRR